MTSGQKIAFSLLVAMGLFAVFVLSLNTKLFTQLESKFYTQSKIAQNTGQLDKISEGCDSYISEILNLIEKGDNAWVKNASVRSFYVQNASESDVNIRRRLTETLFSEIPALTGIRIVDKNGRNVHYSSFDDTDLLKQTGISKIYKNYGDIVKDADEISFEELGKITSETKSVILFDQSKNRLIVSVPFCWVDGIYSGISLFYLNFHEIEKVLTSREIISFGQNANLVSDEDYSGGLIFNIPYNEKANFEKTVKSYWKNRSSAMSKADEVYQQPEKLLEKPDGSFYVALSSNRIGKVRISAVYSSSDFELSKEIRLLIYICIFISILLIVFLIFSFFRDPLVTLQKRIKKIQLGLIENYIDGKEKREWNDLARQLRVRKDDLSSEIIKSLHVHSKKRRKELSDYLDKNWDEIFSIFESKAGSNGRAAAENSASGAAAELTGASIAEIRRMLEEVLQNKKIVAPVVAAAVKAVEANDSKLSPKPIKKVEAVDEAEEVEELAEEADELDDAEEVEELAEEADELDEAEEVEELAEEVDELDEVEEVEELAEEVDELDEAEDVEELAEEVDELDEVEDVEELAEEVDELDEAEEVEELAEEVGELDEAEDVEELAEEVDELDDAEEVEEVEELAEEVDELDEAEEVEELAEEVDELDEAEEVDELDEAEDLDELEGVEEFEAAEKRNKKSFDIMNVLVRTPLDYIPSNETYFASEKFGDVDNIFAEELRIGSEFSIKKETSLEEMFLNSKTVEIKCFGLPEYQNTDPLPKKTDIETEVLEEESLNASEEDIIDAELIEDEPLINETIEDLTEEVPEVIPSSDLVLTNFADNFIADMPELESVPSVENVILEKDGVFSISENLEYTNVFQDPEFKQLVDSIL